MKIHAVTLQEGVRKNSTQGYFADADVAAYVATSLEGHENCTGEVVEIEVDTSATVEAYRALQLQEQQLAEREQFAALYERLSTAERQILDRVRPAAGI